MQHFINPDLAVAGDDGGRARSAAAAAIREVKDREFHSLGLVIGYDYFGSPLVVADGEPLPAHSIAEYSPSAAPGRRAPHGWLNGSSLFDELGSGFTLLDFGGRPSDVAAFVQAAEERAVPLAQVSVQDPALRDAYRRTLALIRPDHHVAWRGDDASDAAHILDTVRGVTASDGKS